MLKSIRHAWILLPCLPYIVISAQYAANIPILDDYDAILEFLLNFKRGNLWEKVGLLFTQYNEHRLVYSRIVYLLYYYVFGNVNFKNLVILGNVNLIVASAFMIHFIKKTGIRYWQIPSILSVFLICDLNTYESGSISMYSWQNHGIIALFFFTLYLWDKKKIVPAVIAQFFLILSSGNGMIGALLIAVYCLTMGRKYFVYCTTALVAFTGLYFIGYEHFKDKDTLPFDLGVAITYFIRQAGAPFSFNNAFAYGSFVWASALLVIPFRTMKENKNLWPLLVVFSWAVLSMWATAMFRSCTVYAQFQTSRYLIYPQLLISILVTLTLKSGKRYYEWGAYGFMVIWIFFYFPYNMQFGISGFVRTQNRAYTRKYWHPDPVRCEQDCKDASNEKIYYIEDNR